MISLKGKKALVTGGGVGIGKGIAMALVDAGADVVVHYFKSSEGAEEVVNYAKSKGQNALAVSGNAVDKKEVEAFMAEASSYFDNELDILVNNVGNLVQRATVEEMSEDLWHKIIDINVTSTFLVSQQAIKLMKENGGKIINMTSIAAHNGGGPGASAYAASKAAVITFSKALAKELAPYNINVNAVSPGFIGETPFHDTFTSKEGRVNAVKGVPLGREGKPGDVAGAALYLASDLADYLTGETIEINGGMFMR